MSLVTSVRNQNNLRLPPQSLEAEMALVGSIMLRSDALYEVIDIVTPASFYFDKHALIFETMLELFAKHQPIDILSLSSRLKEKDLLERVGGQTFLTELSSMVPSSANAKHYAEIVMKKRIMRQLIEASEHLSMLGFEESGDLEEILDQAEKKIFDITQSFSATQNFQIIKPLLSESFERFDRLSGDKHELRGVRTGFEELDHLLGGFQKSDLIIIAARPSIGKTAFALEIARRSSLEYGTSVGFFSLEMTADQLVDRVVASHSMINASILRKGIRDTSSSWGLQIFDNLSKAVSDLLEAKIYIDDQPGNTIMKMRSAARKLKIEKGLDLLIVDYLQLITPSSARGNNDSMVQQVTEISRGLKHIARELKIPVIALSQLSRAAAQNEKEAPKLHHLRDSGAIEQDADVVMFLHRSELDDFTENKEQRKGQRMVELNIEKHRNGPLGKITFDFDASKGLFKRLTYENFGGDAEEIN